MRFFGGVLVFSGFFFVFFKHGHSGCASAPVDLPGQRLHFQLYQAAGIGPLKEHFWFHRLLPVISMTLWVNRGRRFLRCCENRLCSSQVRPVIPSIGGCSCTQACPLPLPPPPQGCSEFATACSWQCNKLSWKPATDFWEQGVLLWVPEYYIVLSIIVKKGKKKKFL